MGKKDDPRTDAEKQTWEKGKFTEAEAKKVGTTAKELNRQNEEAERELGNPTAPPE